MTTVDMYGNIRCEAQWNLSSTEAHIYCVREIEYSHAACAIIVVHIEFILECHSLFHTITPN